jgi:signal transduction histidine kinase
MRLLFANYLLGIFLYALTASAQEVAAVAESPIGVAEHYREELINLPAAERLELLLQLTEHLRTEKPVQAVLLAFDAYHLAQQQADTTSILTALNHIGWLYQANGELQRRLAYAYTQYDIAVAVADTLQIIKALNSLAEDHAELKQYDNALRLLLEAQQLITVQQCPLYKVDNLYQLANIFYHQEDYKIAEALLLQSAAINDTLNNIANDQQIYLLQTDVALAQKNLQAALTAAKKAAALSEEATLADPAFEVALAMRFGQIQREKGNFTQAAAHIERALSFTDKNIPRSQLRQLYQQVVETATTLGNAEQAIAYQLKLADLDQEILEDKKKKEYASLQFQYELERVNKEKDLLAKEQRIQQKDIRFTRIISLFLAIGLMIFSVLAIFLYKKNKQHTVANKQLQLQKQAIQRQKNELEAKNIESDQQKKLLQQKNGELDALNEEKNNLVSMVAHDLKSPLNQIIGLINIVRMEGGSLNGVQQDCLVRIDKSSKRLNEMINQILDLAAIEANRVKINISKVDLTDVLKSLAKEFEHAAVAKGIAIVTSELPLSFFAQVDRKLLTQVMQNLISNAIKFSPYHRKVSLQMRNSTGAVQLIVQDQGPGLTAADKAKLFGKFEKLSAIPTGNECSNGLGLSIVKKYVELMNGRVWVESEPGKGASFIVELPLQLVSKSRSLSGLETSV